MTVLLAHKRHGPSQAALVVSLTTFLAPSYLDGRMASRIAITIGRGKGVKWGPVLRPFHSLCRTLVLIGEGPLRGHSMELVWETV